MSREKKTRAGGRRSRMATVALIGIGLLLTGGAYAGASAAMAATPSSTVATELTVDDGKKLFQANCATCHGMNLEGSENGPGLVGTGELAVEFQMATGRMPMQAQSPQAPQKAPQFTDEQIAAVAAWVQQEGGGATFPDDSILDGGGDIAAGAELFRINCAMCHNVAGAGGALTEGKYAPSVMNTSALHLYAAMVTGPQNMPVFNDMTLTEDEKRDIISAILYMQNEPSPGGMTLGSLGPVSEGLFVWIFGIGALVALTVWITAKSN
ncbi:c-type cytochrome [Microbacterium sp. NC79]|uniref:cytochrome bc1 complex diheme cytochrome c subunit n=1 Tax=Microbacterium sp. NC79 TaxID=2851009 RepID=UPI001C2C20AD|nr:cytochrome c [Microbacterium sp. NC79]MBV0894799.1 cytochrome c [Microbacterium sp. NC79]